MNTIVAYRHAESLFTPDDQWDALAGGVPFRQTVWLKSWWDQFAKQGEFLFVTVLDEADEICGILPLQRNGRRGWQTIAGGRVCSDHVSLLTRPENRAVVAEAVADFLIDNAIDPQLGWARLSFDGTLAGDPAMRMLVDELTHRGAAIRLSTRMNSWFLATQQNWDTFLMKCSRRTRRRYRDMIRLLESNPIRIASDDAMSDDTASDPIRPDGLAVRIADDESAVLEAVETLVDLHQRHWQSKGEPGSYAAAGMKEFVRATACEAFHRGRLLVPTLVRIDAHSGAEQPIAVQLNLIGDDRRLYCYSTAADYDFASLSPGALLNTFTLKYAHDHACSGIDYMRGDEEYKRRLGAEPIPVLAIEVNAPTLQGRIDSKLRDWTFACKQSLRKRLGRPPVRTLTRDEAFDSKYHELLPMLNPLESPVTEDGIDNDDDDNDESLPVILPISLAWASNPDSPSRRLET